MRKNGNNDKKKRLNEMVEQAQLEMTISDCFFLACLSFPLEVSL